MVRPIFSGPGTGTAHHHVGPVSTLKFQSPVITGFFLLKSLGPVKTRPGEDRSGSSGLIGPSTELRLASCDLRALEETLENRSAESLLVPLLQSQNQIQLEIGKPQIEEIRSKSKRWGIGSGGLRVGRFSFIGHGWRLAVEALMT